MPERLSYDEAMLLSAARLKIQDPELKQGYVEKITLRTQVGEVERPWGVEGGFAVVYKFRTKSGALKALRCFRVPMSPDMQYRYEKIGPYFSTHARDITVGFRYHDQGILIKEPGSGKQQNGIYPVIDMDWVEGTTLLERVDELCKQRAHAALKDLTEQWLGIVTKMRQAGIAHGDLAGLNVMVRASGQLVLIDYDGVYIPEFAGLSQVLIGQVDYQHPQMAQRQFNEYMDDFSALVIYTALLVLSVRPDLWIKYVKRPDGKVLDVNLLFTQQDFKEPQASALIRELEQIGNKHIQDTVQELKRQCSQPIDQVRFPFYLIDPSYEQQNQLQRALKDGSIEYIAATYPLVRDALKNLPKHEQQQVEMAFAFMQAYNSDSDNAIINAYNAICSAGYSNLFKFSSHHVARVTLAKQRTEAIARLLIALSSKSLLKIAAAYDSVLDASDAITSAQREQIAYALAFASAYKADDDEALVRIRDAVQSSVYSNFFVFSTDEQQRIVLADKRVTALEIFRRALNSKCVDKIIRSYSTVLDTCINVTHEERHQIELAHQLRNACNAGNDKALYGIWKELQKQPLFILTDEEQRLLGLAEQRHQALETLLKALREFPKDAEHLLAAYDATLLDGCELITVEQRARIDAARQFLKMYHLVKIALDAKDEDAVYRSYNEVLDNEFTKFTEEELKRIKNAIEVSQQHAREALVIAQQKSELKMLLDSGEYEQVIKQAKEMVIRTKKEIESDLQILLSKATMRFIKLYDLTDLFVEIMEDATLGCNYARAYWRWPENDLIKDGLLVWHPDIWPRHPQRERSWQDPRWHHEPLYRQGDKSEGQKKFSIGRYTHIFVRVYARMRDDWNWSQGQEIWRYSGGFEESSQYEAGSQCISWKGYK